MNELELDKLATLAEDTPTLSALSKLLKSKVEEQRPRVRDGDTNDLLGEKFRAYELSKQMVEDALQSINDYKKSNVQKKNLNRGR